MTNKKYWFNSFIVALAAAGVLLGYPAAASTAPDAETDLDETLIAQLPPATDHDQKMGVTATEVKIGSCIALTGIIEERGKQIISGARCYFNYVNEKGGVNGRQINLVSCDDSYDPETAIDCFNTCLKGKVFAGAFFAGSAPISKYIRMGTINKMPLLGFCTGTPALYEFHPTQFVVRTSYVDEMNVAVQDLTKNDKHIRIALIYQNDAFGAAVRENLIKALTKNHIPLVAEGSYDRSETNIEKAINELEAAKPDVVMIGATSEALLKLLKKRHEDKWKPLLCTVSITTDYLKKAPKEQSEGVMVSQVVPFMDPKLPSFSLYSKLNSKYFPAMQPSLSGYEAFTNAMVITEGLKRAGKDLTRNSFVHGLESLRDFDLGAGPEFKVNFSPTSHSGLTATSVYFTIMHDGKLVKMTEADWNRVLKPRK